MPGANGFDVAKRIRELERNYGMSLQSQHSIVGMAAEINDRKQFPVSLDFSV